METAENRSTTLAMLLPENADAALIISETNRRYFTGFVSSLGYLFVTRSGSFLLVDSRYEEAARKQARNCEVILFKKLSDTMKELIVQKKLRSIMLESSAFTLTEADRIEAIFSQAGAVSIRSGALDELIGRQRIIKTSEEIAKMRRAQRITEDSFRETIKLIREGVTEKELALDLEFRMRRSGAEAVSFDLIVLTGSKTSMPHGVPDYTKIRYGDFILFDIGATFEGYHSDMTRTVAFGRADNSQKRIYDTVLQAQLHALDTVREGATCGEVDRAARSYIDNAGYQGLFGHSTGHGVGLDIHEAPSVSPESSLELKSGMVITVEPGIYVQGKGGVRIEDMVVVTSEGYINLALLPKELIVL